MDSAINQINKDKVPQHIAIIMDGNGRWAQQHQQERVFGHQHGVEAVRRVIEAAAEAGVKYLTLYTFSTENWNRPKAEVDALMGILVSSIRGETERLMQNNVRMLAIGDLKSLPELCQQELQGIIDTTSANTGLSVVLALSYSGRQELTNAVQLIANDVKNNKLQIGDIATDVVKRYLYTHNIPDPDILIRTGGEYRISNFLLWQLAYTEFFFPQIMWPDFQKETLWQIIVDFQSRERRFGKTGEQVRSH